MTSKTADEYIQEAFNKIVGAFRVIVSGPLSPAGHVSVNKQPFTSEILDLHFTQRIDTFTIDSDRAVDDKTFDITCDTAPVNGNIVCLKELSSFYQGEIINVVVNGGTSYTITLDSPLDYGFTTAASAAIETQDMNVDGSLTPQIFRVTPVGLVDPKDNTVAQKWNITRFMISINDNAVMDDGKFGALTALTNGIVIRKKNNIYKNIFNAKTNGDFRLHAYDVSYIPAAVGPSGQEGLGVRRTFGGEEKNGAVIRADAQFNDEFQCIIQDNLTGLTKFHMAAQGCIAEE